MKFKEVMLSRSPFEKMHKIVPPYEVPVLKSVHGKDNVHEIAEVEGEPLDVTAAQELQRMEGIYGIDRETKVSHVERALGFNAERDIAEYLAEGGKKKKAA